MYKLLVINPGSTSTKVSYFEKGEEVLTKTLNYKKEELSKYDTLNDQFEMRKKTVVDFMSENGFDINSLDAVVARGGILPPVKSGAYLVNETMVSRLRDNPVLQHASNLGAQLAYDIANKIGVNSYIYDSVAVDEMVDISRISGIKELPRMSMSHVLNSRAMAMKAADELGKNYNDVNIVVAHLGGGVSISAHNKGRLIDVISDEEGPFSPERTGSVPCKRLVDLCYSGKYEKSEMQKMLRGKGGLCSYFNTVDAREVEKMIEDGNEEAAIVYEAMALQISKGMADMAVSLKGDVDFLVVTGGIAYSKMMTDWIEERVTFIAPLVVKAGENEMLSLANGVTRVLNGEENARDYIEA